MFWENPTAQGCPGGTSRAPPGAAEHPVCLQNVTANHRACDVIVCEGKAQVLSGRFMYGPLDVVTLTGEKVLLGSGGHQDTSNRVGCPGPGMGLVIPTVGEGCA